MALFESAPMSELTVGAPTGPPARRGWIQEWNPEDPKFWEAEGKAVAEGDRG